LGRGALSRFSNHGDQSKGNLWWGIREPMGRWHVQRKEER
jgi:hypothetical protein